MSMSGLSQAGDGDFKHCIGLQKKPNGTVEGEYTQSDVQFIQSLIPLIENLDGSESGKLPDDFYMTLNTQFFAQPRQSGDLEVVASELRVDLGEPLKKLQKATLNGENAIQGYEYAGAVSHGYSFEEHMYSLPHELSMENKELYRLMFDADGFYMGLELRDINSREIEHIYLWGNGQRFAEAPDQEDIILFPYHNTRLVGFRSTKVCNSSHRINSITPIYYSIDERVCAEQLIALTPGELEEIPGHGKSCIAHAQDIMLAEQKQAVLEENGGILMTSDGISDTFETITLSFTWAIMVLVLLNTVIALTRCCEERQKRRQWKTEMLGAASQNAQAQARQ